MRNKNYNIFIFTLLLFGTYSQIEAIVSGNLTLPAGHPYQVFLTFDLPNLNMKKNCSGSLISQNFVLTAGSCATGSREATVYLGAYNMTNLTETSRVQLTSTNITVHPDFTTNYTLIRRLYGYDIALVQLPGPVEFNEFIQPIRLPSSGDLYNTFEGLRVNVTGWGTDSGSIIFPDDILLQYMNDTVLPNTQCDWSFDQALRGYQICVRSQYGRTPCINDYGAPMVTDEGVQIGIFTQHVELCTVGYPFIGSRITSFLQWIEMNSDVVIEGANGGQMNMNSSLYNTVFLTILIILRSVS